ncbi:FxsA family protein [Tabrizicola sp.]|uniref:FxsA family protein n=1 Tax=Tabrizicola sp. TaxID=2005166 RepID=UPI001A5E349A|nr:FxsA family protein [Tabrizicola sp.]MBL9072761.1 FxsA family protein [Tabrizicola sp.]
MWIVLGLLAWPLVEIALFVTLGAKLGLWLTLAWVLLTGMLGVMLLKSLALGGRETLRRGFQEGLHDPLSPLAQRALVGVAAVLLILPGFFTDTLGLILLLPPVRAVIIRILGNRMRGVVVLHRGRGFEEDPYEHRSVDDRLE